MSQPAPGCNGTTYVIKKAGDPSKGAISRGDTATVHATGVIKETGKKFWSTKDPGQQPFTYQAGVGGVIKGWDQGCLGMTVGEERELEIPARAPRPRPVPSSARASTRDSFLIRRTKDTARTGSRPGASRRAAR